MVNLEDICMIWDNQTLLPDNYRRLSSTRDNHRKSDHCHLVAGVYESELFRFGDDPHLYICSSQIGVFQLILGYLRCSIDIQVSLDNFGGFKENNSWNGILSLLEQKRADFVPHMFSVTPDREEVLHLSFVIPQRDLLTIVSYPKEIVSKSVLKLFGCFTLETWLMIVLSFVLVGVAVSAICCVKFNRLVYNNQTMQWQSNYHQQCWPKIFSNYFDLFAVLLGQGNVPLERAYRSIELRGGLRTPLLVWSLGTFLFRQLYSSDITAMMLSRTPNIIDHFDQLEDDLSILIENNSLSQVRFVEKFPWLQSKLIPITYQEVTHVDTVARLIETNTVLLHKRDRGDQILRAYENLKLHVSVDGYVNSASSYAVRKSLNEIYQKKLDKLFRWIHYAGILTSTGNTVIVNNLSNLKRKNPTLNLKQLFSMINSPPDKPQNGTNARQLSMVDLENIVTQIESDNNRLDIEIVVRFYLIGIVISGGCFVGEFVMHHLVNCSSDLIRSFVNN